MNTQTKAFPERIFVSDLLPKRHPGIARCLKQIFGRRLRVISGTKDIWCRDYMPVQIGPNQFVRFRYRPDYLADRPDLRTDASRVSMPVDHCRQSRLVMDGGNVLRFGSTAIVTSKVYRENRPLRPAAVRQLLKRQLAVERLIVIPPEPGDALGHADGVLRFIDERTVLMKDYRRIDPDYGRRLTAVLRRRGLKIVLCPYVPTDDVGDDGIASAVGVYVNFLLTGDTLVCPTYGLRQDRKVILLLKRCYPGRRVVPIRCRTLADSGGVLNCVTWQVALAAPAESGGRR